MAHGPMHLGGVVCAKSSHWCCWRCCRAMKKRGRSGWVQVVAIDVGRQERVVTGGQDHTCRVWKIPEESQLIFR